MEIKSASQINKKWSEHSKEDKEMYLNSFFDFLREKLLDEKTTEVNFDYNKGVSRTRLGGMVLTQEYNGKETLILRINHTGDLDDLISN